MNKRSYHIIITVSFVSKDLGIIKVTILLLVLFPIFRNNRSYHNYYYYCEVGFQGFRNNRSYHIIITVRLVSKELEITEVTILLLLK